MHKTTLASFREKLEQIRFTMIGDVRGKYKNKKDDLNGQVADIADAAAQSYNRQLMMGFGEQEWKKLRLVEEAIEKMDDGQYGICSECKEPIPDARLQVIPFTAHCVGCLETIEKDNS